MTDQTSEMIYLRDVQPEDEDRVRLWRNLREVSNYMFTDHEISREEHRTWFSRVLVKDHCHYWIVVAKGMDVGTACIFNLNSIHRRAHWACYIANVGSRGHGIGSVVQFHILTHVFEQMAYHKLCCEALTTNKVALRMYDQVGFRQEGYLREHIIKGGKARDVVLLAMLRRDWALHKPRIEDALRKRQLI